MSHYRSRRWILGLAAAVVLAVLVTSLAIGQASRQMPGAAAVARAAQIQQGLFIPGMKEVAIQLPTARLTEVTRSKQQADLNVLRNAYFIRDNIPHLRLALGKEVMLVPLETMEGAPPTAREMTASLQLPTALRAYSAYAKLQVSGKIPAATTPPTSIDHRSGQTPIKDQQNRGTCVAFGSMAGLEAKYGGAALDLSEQDAYHLYMRQESRTCWYNYGLQTTNSADYLKTHAVCAETYWPYTNYAGLGSPPANPDTHRPSAASTNAKYRIKTFDKIWRDEELATDSGAYINNPTYLESLLHAGQDIIFGTHVAGWSGSLTGVIDVLLGPGGTPLPSEGGHCMLIVGYNRPSQYFIVKNSWGPGVGQSGYLHLSYDYIRTYAKYGYVITAAEPLALTVRPAVIRRLPLPRRTP